MALSAQSVTPDAVSFTAPDGTTVTFTSAQAKKFATPALAQAALYALVQKQLGQHIGPRCLYVGIDANFQFTAGELVSAENPPARKFAFDALGNLHVTAWDGAQTTILRATVLAQPQPLAYLKAQVAAALCGDATAQYDLQITLDAKSGNIASIGADFIADTPNPLVAKVQPPAQEVA